MPAWAAAVLCGGRSRRMGRDKALLVRRGEPMAVGVTRALSEAGAEEVIAVGGDPAGLSAAGLTWAADDWPGEGPLGGLLTSLRHLPYELVFVASCDLVAPSAEAMAATVTGLHAELGADVAAPVVGRDVQWLHAAWRRRAVDALAERFAAGDRAVHRAVGSAGLVVAMVGGLDPSALLDADTLDDFPE